MGVERLPVSRNLRGVVACLVLALPFQGQAAEGDIPWFETHARERLATLRSCRDDERLARGAICANAERAQDRVEARQNSRQTRTGTPSTIDSVLTDPGYWASNRIARAGALAECTAGLLPAAQCAAVRAGESLDGNGVRRRGT